MDEPQTPVGLRWTFDPERNHIVARLESFADVVFGFAIFMLATNVKVPGTPDELAAQGKNLLVFALNFTVLCGLWWGHGRMMRTFFVPDGISVALNFAFLGAIALFSYPLQLYFRFKGNPITVAAYAAGLGSVFGFMGLMVGRSVWVHRGRLSDVLQHRACFALITYGAIAATSGVVCAASLAGIQVAPTLFSVLPFWTLAAKKISTRRFPLPQSRKITAPL